MQPEQDKRTDGPRRDPLPAEVRAKLEPVLQRFDGAWRRGDRPDLEDYLKTAEAERAFLLLELVHADLEHRLKAGEPARVEDYLARYPELGRDPAAQLELIAAECRLRRGRDPAVSPEEYLRRFPGRGRELLPLLLERPGKKTVGGAGDPTREGLAPPEGEATVPQAAPPEGASPPLPTIPGYQVLEVLGRGGTAVVYKAWQVSLQRPVALKMILTGAHAGPAELERFRTEAEVVARLQHPNIVGIYEIGRHDGCPYLCLEYVPGGSLYQKMRGRPLPARQAAGLVETLARAVHHAHQRGVIHRDLKPGNVLLAEDGTPKIADFGLAKRLDREGGRTHTGDILGTPSYMAPEQAAGDLRRVGPATDVYALGAILYELLTGRPVFRDKTLLGTLLQVKTEEPVPPAHLRPGVPRDLDTVCLTCLHKDPARRYASALALAEDLRAFLAGEPVAARPAGARERAVRWLRRQPAVALFVGAAVMAVAGLVAGVWWRTPVALGAAGVLGLLAGVGWYGARLKAALGELTREQLAAERHVERLRLLLEMTGRLITAPDREALLRRIGEATARLAHADRATIYLLDLERGELWSRIALGDGVGEIRVPLGVGLSGTVARTGEWINIDDAYADPRFNPEIDRKTGYRTRNLLTLPMKAADGRVVGVLQVLNKRQGPFLPDDIEVLSALASSAALAVESV